MKKTIFYNYKLIILAVLIFAVFLGWDNNFNNNNISPVTKNTNIESVKAVELIEERNLNSKVFDNKDGTFTMEAHTGHIHYKDKETKKFEDIKTAFVSTGKGWEMRKASYEVELPKYVDDWFKFINSSQVDSATREDISISDEEISFTPLNAGHIKGELQESGNKIVYSNAFGNNTDLMVIARNIGFDKWVVINEKPRDLRNDLEFSFKLNLPEDVQVEFKNDDANGLHSSAETMEPTTKIWTGEEALITSDSIILEKLRQTWFREFKLWDSENNYGKMKIKLEKKEEKYILTKILDKEFLKNAVYPVYTDTTTSYYAGAGDGYVESQNVCDLNQACWDGAHDATSGDVVNYNNVSLDTGSAGEPSTPFYSINRAFFPIDTSGLPDDATISTAVLKLYVSAQNKEAGEYSVVVQTTQASTASLVLADFNQCGSVDSPTEGSDHILATASQYNDWTLDATGRGWISKTGWTKLGLRGSYDVLDSMPGEDDNTETVRASEYADTTSDPYLSITYSSSVIYTLATTTGQTINISGNLTIGDGTNEVVATGATYNPNISVTGNVLVADKATWTNTSDTSKTLNIDGNLTINSTGGIFTAPAGTGATAFTLGGNFANSGTFTHNNGRITFDGNGGANNQTLSGTTATNTFHQLYLSAGGIRTVYFTDSNNYAVADDGTLSLQGTSSYTLSVARSGSSDHWNLQVSLTGTTVDVDYINASWSDASGYKEIDASNGTNINGGDTINWNFGSSGVAIEGTVYLENETTIATSGNGGPCDGSASVISIRVNGGTVATGSCSSSDATFNITTDSAPVAGDTITVYLTSAQKANTVYTSDSTADTGIDLYINAVIVRHENGGPLTILNMLDYDSTTDNTNMLFDAVDAAPDTLTIESGNELHIWDSKTFTPGGTVTTQGTTGDLHLDSNSNINFEANAGTISGNVDIDIGATLTAPSSNLNVAGNYTNAGTFTHSSGTVTFDKSVGSQTISGTNTWHNLIIDNDTASEDNNVDPDAVQTVMNLLTVNYGKWRPHNGDDYVSVTINDFGVMLPDASASITVSGNWSNSGIFTHSSGIVTFDATDTGNTLSGTLNGTSSFNKIAFNGLGGSWTIQDAMKVSAANATDTFVIGNGTVTLGNGGGDHLEINGKMTIAATSGQTGTFQTMDGLTQGNNTDCDTDDICIDVNSNSAVDRANCANCIIQVGTTGADSGQGNLKIRENALVRLNPFTAATDTGIEVEKNGYLEIKGNLDDTGIATGTTETTITASAEGWGSNAHQNKHVRITNSDSLAFGTIHDISSNTATVLTIPDNFTASETTGSYVSATRIYTSNASMILADNDGIGQYLYNSTQNKRSRIVDSTEGGAADTITIANTPDTFAYTSGDTVMITYGILTDDTFEILDYAHISAENGTACDATINQSFESYIYAKQDSESLIQYADICDLGKSIAYKYGLSFYTVDGSQSNEGVTVDKSRVHNSYNGMTYMGGSFNTISSNQVYGTLSRGIYFYSLSNNTISSNHVYNSSDFGIHIQDSENNSLSSNQLYNNAVYGIYLYGDSNNNTLFSNQTYGSPNYGIRFLSGPNNNTLFSNQTYGNAYGIVLFNSSNNNILFSNNSYSNTYGLYSDDSSGITIINDNYGGSGANSTADIYFADNTSASTVRCHNCTLASTTEADNITYTGAYLISSKHDTSNGSTKIWGEYSVSDEDSETPQIEATDKFNYADNLYEKSATAHGYSGTGTEDTDLDYDLSTATLSSGPYAYRAVAQAGGTANCATPTIFDIYRNNVDTGLNATCNVEFTDTSGSVNVKFKIDGGTTAYVLGDSYTFTTWDASGDTNEQKSLEIKQAGDTVTVGSGESLEIKGGGSSSGDFTTVTFAPATGSWDLNNNTGSELTFQEATIEYLKVNAGTVTVLNTTLNNEVAPTAGAVLNADWYLGAHVVDENTPANPVDTAIDDITISENSGAPVATVYKYSGGAWTGPAITQTTETDSNGLMIQPGTNDAIRIREYKRESGGYTYYDYNMYIDWTDSYGAYDYKEDQGGYYITSTLNSSGNDKVISESWLRNNIDVNNNDGTRNDPPANGTWYVGMLTGLSFAIDDYTVDFGAITPGDAPTNQFNTLSVTTSATNGYTIKAWAVEPSSAAMACSDAGSCGTEAIADYGGTNLAPTEWITGAGFGYSTNDDSLLTDTANRFFGSKYAGFIHTGGGELVADRSGAECPCLDETNIITYRLASSNAQLPGTYQATIIYVLTAQY